MKEAREEFYKLCTLEGLVKNCGGWISLLYKCSIIIYLVSIVSITMILNILSEFFLNSSIFSDNIFTNYWLYAWNIVIIIISIMLSLLLIYQLVNKQIIKNFKKKYKEELIKFKKEKKSGWKKNLKVFDFNNEYHQLINYLTNIGEKSIDNNYFSNASIGLIEEMVKYNQSQIQRKNDKINNLSNKVFYAFFGGILISKVIDVMFDFLIPLAKDEVTVASAITTIVFFCILILMTSLIIIKIYNYGHRKILNSEESKEISKFEVYNEYLIEKKIELLKKTTKQ